MAQSEHALIHPVFWKMTLCTSTEQKKCIPSLALAHVQASEQCCQLGFCGQGKQMAFKNWLISLPLLRFPAVVHAPLPGMEPWLLSSFVPGKMSGTWLSFTKPLWSPASSVSQHCFICSKTTLRWGPSPPCRMKPTFSSSVWPGCMSKMSWNFSKSQRSLKVTARGEPAREVTSGALSALFQSHMAQHETWQDCWPLGTGILQRVGQIW